MILSFIILAIFAVGMITTVIKDATSMTIPNWVSLFMIVSFFAVLPFVWQGWENLFVHLGSGFLFFLLGLFMFAMNWLGGGDAKLMAAIALWWTWPDLFVFTMYTALAGGLVALFILCGRTMVPVRFVTSPWIYRLIKDEKKMPYGLALAAGALMTLPQSDIFMKAATVF